MKPKPGETSTGTATAVNKAQEYGISKSEETKIFWVNCVAP